MTTEAITRIEPQPMAIQRVDVAGLLSAIVKAGVTSDAALAIKELVQLQNQQNDRQAKLEWTHAFAEARSKCKTIQADKSVEIQGKVAWDYAPLPSLLDAIEPICEPLGLSISFDSTRDGNICTGICIVYHDSGHSERRTCSMNVANAMGKIADMGAITTCQRKALCLMFSLKVRKMEEGDPRIMGELITPAEAEELETRCASLKSEKYKAALLKYLHAADFGSVYNSRMADARRSLAQAEEKFRTMKPNPVAAGTGAYPSSGPAPAAALVNNGTDVHGNNASGGVAADGGASPKVAADHPSVPQPSFPTPPAASPTVPPGGIGGVTFLADPNMPVGTIEFRQNGKTIGKITNVATVQQAAAEVPANVAGIDASAAPARTHQPSQGVIDAEATPTPAAPEKAVSAPCRTIPEARQRAEAITAAMNDSQLMEFIVECAGSGDADVHAAWVYARTLQKIGTRGVVDLMKSEKVGVAKAIWFHRLKPKQ